MKRILYLDAFSGISGDMFLGALIDAGLSLEQLIQGLEALPLQGYRLAAQKVYRGPFHATRLKVELDSASGSALGASGSAPGAGGPSSTPGERPGSKLAPAQDHGHTHSHSQGGGQGAGHSHSHNHGPGGHSHGHSHSHGGGAEHESSGSAAQPQRDLQSISALIRSSRLPAPVQERALRVFQKLGEAEAKVHGVPIETIHFHEVGAVDSIVDICGACLGLHYLRIDEVWCSPITLGTGFAHGAHGTFPLPPPATVEILRGIPVRQRDTGFELCTPTGAALAASLSSGFGVFPPMTLEAVGYGAGNDRPGEVPNVLRVLLGASAESGEKDRVIQLEANIDDMNPQWLGYLQEQLFEAGALEVTLTPIWMKKSRPGTLLTALVRPGKEAEIEALLFKETTTFGLRKQEVDRIILSREMETVATPWGDVRVKVGRRGGEALSANPEYEDIRKIAASTGLPIKEISRRVMELFHQG